MITPLQVLLVADGDVSRFRIPLVQGGYDPEICCVSSLDDLDDAVEDEDWDIVIIDTESLPISEVVQTVKDEQPGVPILAIAGDRFAPLGAAVPATDERRNLAVAVAGALNVSQPCQPADETLPEDAAAPSSDDAGSAPMLPAMPVLGDNLSIGLYQSTPEGRLLYANAALIELLGYDSTNELDEVDLENVGYPRNAFAEQMRLQGFVKNLTVCWTDRNQQTKYTREHATAVRDAEGHVLYYEGTMEDVTESRTREIEDTRLALRSLAQQKALVELAGLPGENVESMVRRATELSARHLGCERVLVATTDDSGEQIHCLDLFSLQQGEHGIAPSQPTSNFEIILNLLTSTRCLVVDDATSDDRVEHFGIASYIDRNEIGAMLIAPVRKHGQVVGLINFQHVGGQRKWSAQDVDFAATVGELLTLIIDRGERSQAEAALKESENLYRVISELSSDFAYAVHVHADGQIEIAWATEAFERITGYTTDEIDALDGLIAIVHQDYKEAAQALLSPSTPVPSVEIEFPIITKSGEERWTSSRAQVSTTGDSEPRVIYVSSRDITDRKRMEEQLVFAFERSEEARQRAEEARDQAEEVARLKTAFLANMSHEIRTPLTGVLGFASLLAEEAEGEAKEFAEYVERSGLRLLNTLDSVLDIARIEGDRVVLDLDDIDVRAEAEQVCALLKPMADQKGIALVLAPTDAAIYARVDQTCLGRIITNLVGNAIKFTEEGEVEISVRADGEKVYLVVRDSGKGIDPDFIPHLFDEYRQESNRTDPDNMGSGLGLSICKRLVDVLDGSIEVASERPGGTTFTVVLPRSDEAAHHVLNGDGASGNKGLDPVIIRPADEEQTEASAQSNGDGEGDMGADGFESDTAADARYSVTEFLEAEDSTGDDEQETAAIEEDPTAEVTDSSERGGTDADGLDEEETLPQLIPSGSSQPRFEFDEQASYDSQDENGAGHDPVDSTTSHDNSVIAAIYDQDVPEPKDYLVNVDEFVSYEGATVERPDLQGDALPQVEYAGEEPAQAEPPGAASETGFDDRAAVLVVEDNPDTRMLLERILQRSYKVHAVGDARSALILMNENRFDGFVLDINLGGRETGVDVLRVARTLPGYARVFAIALTAYALPGDRERFLQAGFDKYVSKPFTRSALMSALSDGLPVGASV